MERLVKMIEFPDGTKQYDFSNEVVHKYMTNHSKGVYALFENLFKYEETGLEPEKLKEIDKLYLAKCEEVNRLKAELEERCSNE